ncbi:MAG TPA: helix-turn-helix domain-containing protein, partial [Gemmatimonadaceae bacterium]|nr:helix-turn-helix domain-containing protein [Gemmatimonadaceae bacterium]
MDRDREATRNKLMDAVERIAIRDGFEACGVNAIAQEAGVDKVLIYRYFGGVDGLISTVIAERAAWPKAAPLPDGGSPGSTLSSALIDQARAIR